MPLCDICKEVPFGDLPPFPEEEYFRTLTGLEYVQILVRNKVDSRDGTASGVRHHANIENLRKAAAEGCELCRLIQGEAHVLLTELEGLEGPMKEYYNPPTFNMWLTKRPGGGQGFWVLSECRPSVRGAMAIPIAAFGFTVAEGIFEPWPMLKVVPSR
jgi:hypothetical protein